MRKYYVFSVLFGLVMSLLGLYMARFGESTGMVALLIWIIVFLYAFFKRDEVLESKWKKRVIITLSSLFLVGTLGSMVIFLVLPLLD